MAVRLYADAVRAGDAGTAYRVLSARCRNRVSEPEFAAQAGRLRGLATVRKVKAKLQGTRALLSYTYPQKALNRSAEPWVRERTGWKKDSC